MKRPKTRDHDEYDEYSIGYNEAVGEYEVFLIERLEKIQSLLPPRGKKKNIINLLNNWKKHINAVDRLILEIKVGRPIAIFKSKESK